MPLQIPPELKKITPYVRRAEELDRDKGNPESRLVSYYCRQYAVHAGILLATSPAGKASLGELLENLEGEKEVMDSFTRDESKFLCTKFAEKIFDKADLEDRAGEANKNTARTFYAAASFLEILQQFHGDDDNSEEVSEQKKKSVYCKWKATEILKAIKEGRAPTKGGYGEDNNNDDQEKEEEAQVSSRSEPGSAFEELPIAPSIQTPFLVETVNEDNEKEETPMNILSNDDDEENDDSDSSDGAGTEVQLGPPPAYPTGIEPIDHMMPPAPPTTPAIPKPPMTFNPPPVPTMDLPPPVLTKRPTPPPAKPKKASFLGGMIGSNKKKNKQVGKVEIADAAELTRFALAALMDKDTDLAADRLQQALKILGR